jgi:predicted enzyme related to lactoylglutathione lyase
MLADYRIGFNIPVADVACAKQFYAEKLSLTSYKMRAAHRSGFSRQPLAEMPPGAG